MTNSILVVDDSSFTRKVLATYLSAKQYDVGTAKDVEEAEKLYKQNKYDLVLMDVTMPGKSGIKGVSVIKQINPKAKVIMLSAMGQNHVIKKAMDAGALGFINKPYKVEELYKTIQDNLD